MVRIIPHYQNSIRMKAEDVSGKEGVGSTMDEVLSWSILPSQEVNVAWTDCFQVHYWAMTRPFVSCPEASCVYRLYKCPLLVAIAWLTIVDRTGIRRGCSSNKQGRLEYKTQEP